MRPFTKVTARAVPLLIDNLDTDQIIPKQFLKGVDRAGLARGLFFDLRFEASGAAKPGFPLDEPRYAGAQILIAGENFGCGSSREHAAWALADFGVRCVIAPSFADIFAANAAENGMLTIVLPREAVAALAGEAKGGNHLFEVDLATGEVRAPSGARFCFSVDPARRKKLLEGLDSIGETLSREAAIAAYEMKRGLGEGRA
ncbi:MAG: 3-isopropylmalate dehydratase small subunit [Caulobacteraceae bacterium]